MSRRFDRFLRHFPIGHHEPTLGRVFSVNQETWKLSDDPKAVRPKRQVLASGRTASDAADFAREVAEEYDEHGFHKPSGAWWASDGVQFHRFAIKAGRKTGQAVLIGGLAAGAAAAVAFFAWRGRRGAQA